MIELEGALASFNLKEGIFALAPLELVVRIPPLCLGFGMLTSFIHKKVPITGMRVASTADLLQGEGRLAWRMGEAFCDHMGSGVCNNN